MFSVCTEQRGQSPHSDKEIFLTLRATGHKQAREHPSGKCFIGGRVEKKEVGSRGRWGEKVGERESACVNEVKLWQNNLIAPARYTGL